MHAAKQLTCCQHVSVSSTLAFRVLAGRLPAFDTTRTHTCAPTLIALPSWRAVSTIVAASTGRALYTCASIHGQAAQCQRCPTSYVAARSDLTLGPGLAICTALSWCAGVTLRPLLAWCSISAWLSLHSVLAARTRRALWPSVARLARESGHALRSSRALRSVGTLGALGAD